MSALERAISRVGSQDKLASAIGVSQSLVSQWLNGAPINTKHFPKIEVATGVTAQELLEDELRKLDRSSAPPAPPSAARGPNSCSSQPA